MRHVRSCLPPEVLRTVACSIVSAKLDYFNSLLYGTTKANIAKLQIVQNSLARVVTGTRKFDHITPVLAKLHWLPVSSRITYKIAILTHKTLSTSKPGYLHSTLHRHLPSIITRSANKNHLLQPDIRNYRSDFSRRGFTNSAPTIWNNLPADITDSSISRDVFVKRLKTHLYRSGLRRLVTWSARAHDSSVTRRTYGASPAVYLLTYLLKHTNLPGL